MDNNLENLYKSLNKHFGGNAFVILSKTDDGIPFMLSSGEDNWEDMLGEFMTTEEGIELIMNTIFTIESEGEHRLFDAIQNMVNDIRNGVYSPNELCKDCVNFKEKSHGFGYCKQLGKDIDGEDENWKVVGNKNGCISFNDKRNGYKESEGTK